MSIDSTLPAFSPLHFLRDHLNCCHHRHLRRLIIHRWSQRQRVWQNYMLRDKHLICSGSTLLSMCLHCWVLLLPFLLRRMHIALLRVDVMRRRRRDGLLRVPVVLSLKLLRLLGLYTLRLKKWTFTVGIRLLRWTKLCRWSELRLRTRRHGGTQRPSLKSWRVVVQMLRHGRWRWARRLGRCSWAMEVGGGGRAGAPAIGAGGGGVGRTTTVAYDHRDVAVGEDHRGAGEVGVTEATTIG
jgi:hypothetical protein